VKSARHRYLFDQLRRQGQEAMRKRDEEKKQPASITTKP